MPVELIELPPKVAPPAAQGFGSPVLPSSPTAQPGAQPESVASSSTPPLPTKIYLATPCYGCQMSVVFMSSVVQLQAACAQRGIELLVDFVGNESLIERARNILVARFLLSDASHLLFIDADIGFNPAAVFRLLEFDKDVTTAVYAKKAFEWDRVRAKLEQGEAREPVFQMGLDFNINIASAKEPVRDGFAKVLDSATGFMLIKRHVLQRMTDHYRRELHCVNDIPGQTLKDYVAIFACLIDPDTRRFLSEDYSFCRRYQALGGEIWADLASPLAHIGTNIFHGDLRARMACEARAAAA